MDLLSQNTGKNHDIFPIPKKWKKYISHRAQKRNGKNMDIFGKCRKCEKWIKNGYFRENIICFSISGFSRISIVFPCFFFGWEKISIFPTSGRGAPKYLFFVISGHHAPTTYHFLLFLVTGLCFAWLVFHKCLVTSIANVFLERKHSNSLCVAIVKYMMMVGLSRQ